MASAAEQLAANLNFGALAKSEDLKNRIWFTLGALIVYRLGSYIPIPGVDAAELAKFAAHPLVSIGNHGCSHECLTAYSHAEALEIVTRAQKQLTDITGKVPTAIAYPYGLINAESVAASREAGLKLGFVTRAKKFYLRQSADAEALMRIGRVSIWSEQPIEPQCELARADLMWHARYRAFVEKRKAETR